MKSGRSHLKENLHMRCLRTIAPQEESSSLPSSLKMVPERPWTLLSPVLFEQEKGWPAEADTGSQKFEKKNRAKTMLRPHCSV